MARRRLGGGSALVPGDSKERATRSAHLGAEDAERSALARRIQERHRGWLVMWSVWHRTFTAFGCFSPGPLVVDEPDAVSLTDAMLRIELAHSTNHP